MFTRKDYLDAPLEDRKAAHRRYYAQFVTSHLRDIVRNHIGVPSLKACDDQRHFNDIPLARWDRLAPIPVPFRLDKAMREAGDYPTQAGLVCILKEAARQLVEGSDQ